MFSVFSMQMETRRFHMDTLVTLRPADASDSWETMILAAWHTDEESLFNNSYVNFIVSTSKFGKMYSHFTFNIE